MKNSTELTTITVHVPMTFAIRGGRKVIISDPDQVANQLASVLPAGRPAVPLRTENALLKALARAHRWQRMIESGVYASITELAKAEKVNESYACRVLRLTLLSPSIVIDIVDSRCPSDLMLKRLMKPLPVHWDEQIAALVRTDDN